MYVCSYVFICMCMYMYSKVYSHIFYFPGILCGQCTDGAGVTALLNRCVHCSNANAILIGAICMSNNNIITTCHKLCHSFFTVLTGIIVSSILLLCHITLPEWLYPFLFYIQVSSYIAKHF